MFLHITRTICLLSSSNDMSDKEHHFEEANHASHLEWMGRGTAVLVIYLLSKDQEQSRLEVTTSTAIVFRHIRQLSMPSSCFITEPSHCDILGGQAKGLMCGPANMSFVEDIGPFWMVLLHFALCRYRVHEFLTTKLVAWAGHSRRRIDRVTEGAGNHAMSLLSRDGNGRV